MLLAAAVRVVFFLRGRPRNSLVEKNLKNAVIVVKEVLARVLHRGSWAKNAVIKKPTPVVFIWIYSVIVVIIFCVVCSLLF